MKDDGYAYFLRIPSIFIEKKDGEHLMRYLKDPNAEK